MFGFVDNFSSAVKVCFCVYLMSSVDSTLILSNVQPSQSGVYQCVVKNGLGVDHASATLTVIESMHGIETIIIIIHQLSANIHSYIESLHRIIGTHDS